MRAIFLALLFCSIFVKSQNQCDGQFLNLCPNTTGIDRFECVVSKERRKKGTVSPKCRVIATAALVNLNRSDLDEVASKPFNHPTQCHSLGLQGMGQWWKQRTAVAQQMSHSLAREDAAMAITAVDFTIITQVSKHRLGMVGEFCKRWQGDIVAAVSGIGSDNMPPLPPGCGLQTIETGIHRAEVLSAKTSKKLEELVEVHDTRTAHEGGSPKSVSTRRVLSTLSAMRRYSRGDFDREDAAPRSTQIEKNATLRDKYLLSRQHDGSPEALELPRRSVLLLPVEGGARFEPYPINVLRNHALCRVRTTHALYLDIDLLPSRTLYAQLHLAKALHPQRFSDPQHATVVPAFEMRQVNPECGPSEDKAVTNKCAMEMAPKNFDELSRCRHAQQRCCPFDRYGNPEGHASTGYEQWYNSTKTHLRLLKCFRSVRFEPYLVLPAGPLTPQFEELFAGYGKNKIQHTMHLQAVGFRFSVLPRAFVIHFPHPPSESRKMWDVSKWSSKDIPQNQLSQRETNDALYGRFLVWLKQEYGPSVENEVATYRPNGTRVAHSSGNASPEGSRPTNIRTPICDGVVEGMTYTQKMKRRSKTGGKGVLLANAVKVLAAARTKFAK